MFLGWVQRRGQRRRAYVCGKTYGSSGLLLSAVVLRARARTAIVTTLAADPRSGRKHKAFRRHGQATRVTKAQNVLSPLSPRGIERGLSRFDARMGRGLSPPG